MTQSNDIQSSDEVQNHQIGAFSGYNRRPQPAISGLTANFYGENGPDSDSISALSLTKYQDLDVFIIVYLVKDPLGKIMKDPISGKYPKISSFLARIQRPKPQKDGMLAQFFASNGNDADEVNNLGLSKFLDALVYIEIYPQKIAKTPTIPLASIEQETTQELDEVAKHLTIAERKQLDKKQKIFAEANRQLVLSGFFQQPTLWHSLGTPMDFHDWLTDAQCCYPADEPCKLNPIIVVKFEQNANDFHLLPFCNEHKHKFDEQLTPGGIAFLRMRHKMLIQIWAQECLKNVLQTPHNFELDPQKVMNFCIDKKLSQYVPATYLNKVLPH